MSDAIAITPDAEQRAGWVRAAAAAGQDLDAWLAQVADVAALEDGMERERVWPLVVKLKHPVKAPNNDTPIGTLTVRRGKIGDMKGIRITNPLPADVFITIAARLTGQPTQVIEALDIDDSDEVMEIARSFFERAMGARGTR